MTAEPIPISPATQAALLALAASTGRPVTELLEAAVKAYSQQLGDTPPVATVPGVNPADVWDAAAEADAGKLTAHADVFARLRNRS